MQTRFHNVCLYTAILSVSCIVALNPVTYGFFLPAADWWDKTLSRSSLIFADAYLLLIGAMSIFYMKKGNGKIFSLMCALFVFFLPSLFCVEVALNYYKQNAAADERGDVPKFDNYDADSELGWVPRPNHVFVESFIDGPTVKYRLDEEGRRPIATSENAKHRIFVFGDSFLFGMGVGNDSIALSLLSKKLGPRVDIYDYAVSGYGLEQMYARFLRISDRLRPGDIVLFAPFSEDLTRNLISKRGPCFTYFRNVLNKRYETFPAVEDGRLILRDLSRSCSLIKDLLIGRSPLLFGRIYRAILAWWNRDGYIRNADAIFGAAKKITESKPGVTFKLIFIASAEECIYGKHGFDLSALTTPFDSMMRFCPADPETAERLHHTFDSHWSVEGNRWAADALAKMLTQALPL